MDLNEFFQGTASLITALGTLLSSIAVVISAIAKVKRKKSIPPSYSLSGAAPRKRRWFDQVHIPTFAAGMVLLAISVGLFVGRTLIEPPSMDERLTNEAWAALDAGDYAKAIEKSEQVIDLFWGQAERDQKNLEHNNEPMFAVGKVSKVQEATIHQHGVLNHVATCYFIQGEAYAKSGNNAIARLAYREAQKFTYARTYDTAGWYWSPAETAGDRISRMK